MKEVSLSQGTVTYHDEGSGPPVVFVHGFLVDARLWRQVIPVLSRTHRCIAPNWPVGSHELPMNPEADVSPLGVARIVADLLAALELDDVTLVGNDSGGAISQLVAAHHPERIGRLVLTNCDVMETFPPSQFAYLRMLPKVPGLVWLTSNALFRSARLRRRPMAYGKLSKKGLPDDLTRSWLEPCIRSPAIRRDIVKFLGEVHPRLTIEAAEILATRDLPVLLLWAPEDPFFSIDLAKRLQGKLRHARLETIADAYAFVPEDQPEKLAQAIAEFATPPPSGADHAQSG